MDEITKKALISELYFSREAAQYLGVPLQRLEELVRGGVLNPIKKSASEALFLRGDLDECRQHKPKAKREIIYKSDMELNHPYMQKAISYFTLRSFCGNLDEKAEAIFSKAGEKNDMERPLEETAAVLAQYLDVSKEEIIMKGKRVRQSFKALERDDLVVGRDAEEYPRQMKGRKNLPPYLFLRGEPHLLRETIIGICGCEKADQKIKEKTTRLSKALGNAGVIIACGAETEIERTALKNGYKPILIMDTPLPNEEDGPGDDLTMEIAERGLILSAFPPSAETDEKNPLVYKDLLNAVSSAMLDPQEGKNDEDVIRTLQMKLDRTVEAEEKENIAVSGQTDIFSKGIKVEYVYHTK
ncbi:DNA-processing protein DprA [Anaerovorax odorimutans]|uniref:DNA-processing protein DprA n=1 Tax=Anaerovorax odorimutans TaxID=109327 RepID=A0ABT1RQ62_9FIRM|nr:DNA-processing protein DprA [Anaerovorax odorimutans]MCQ4637334.1 DNA-processing protein DprA [Anaerovorax odorimutans]